MSRVIRHPLKVTCCGVALAAVVVIALLARAAGAPPASAAQSATIATGKSCYLVGQAARLTGSGFVATRIYTVTIDGIYFGQSTTSTAGAFAISVHPGGLPAGAPQHVDHLQVSDGTNLAETTFTVTRSLGARFLTSRGNPQTVRGRFQVWGFSLGGVARPVYVHYVNPSGQVRKTVQIGRAAGQCGYLTAGSRRLFPLSVSPGTWTLQLDSHRAYNRHPGGPVTRIRVTVDS
jgi:hypothetical protein